MKNKYEKLKKEKKQTNQVTCKCRPIRIIAVLSIFKNPSGLGHTCCRLYETTDERRDYHSQKCFTQHKWGEKIFHDKSDVNSICL